MSYQLDFALVELNAFVMVVDAGGFTAAEKNYGVRKATLSQRVKSLEARLGCTLMLRTTRAMRLTEAGEEIYRSAREALGLARAALEGPATKDNQLAGTLRLTVPPTLAEFILTRALLPLRQAHPNVAVELDSSPRIVDLSLEEFDLAVRVGPLPDSSLKCRAIGALKGGWFASPGYLARMGAPERPEDLIGHVLIDLARAHHRSHWPFWYSGKTIWRPIAPALTLPDFTTGVEAARRGFGILRATVYNVTHCLKEGSLVPVLAEFALPEENIYAVFPDGPYRQPKIQAALDYLASAFSSGQ